MDRDPNVLLATLYQNIPKICATDAQLLKLHHYETDYGIFDHEHDNDRHNPLALIAMREAEKTNGPLFERMKEYRERQIKDHWGLNWIEFINQPREVCEFQIRMSLQAQQTGVAADADNLRKMQQELGLGKE